MWNFKTVRDQSGRSVRHLESVSVRARRESTDPPDGHWSRKRHNTTLRRSSDVHTAGVDYKKKAAKCVRAHNIYLLRHNGIKLII